jgi:DNA-binding NarL/FixJ family response regulator
MGPSVLIVDDHEDVRRSARALLQAEGFAVVGEAGDGAEAIAKVRPFARTSSWWIFGCSVDIPTIAWLATHALYLHRGPLIHGVVWLPAAGSTPGTHTAPGLAAAG